MSGPDRDSEDTADAFFWAWVIGVIALPFIAAAGAARAGWRWLRQRASRAGGERDRAHL